MKTVEERYGARKFVVSILKLTVRVVLVLPLMLAGEIELFGWRSRYKVDDVCRGAFISWESVSARGSPKRNNLAGATGSSTKATLDLLGGIANQWFIFADERPLRIVLMNSHKVGESAMSRLSDYSINSMINLSIEALIDRNYRVSELLRNSNAPIYFISIRLREMTIAMCVIKGSFLHFDCNSGCCESQFMVCITII